LIPLNDKQPFSKFAACTVQSNTRAVLSQGNRAKPCKFRYVKPVGVLHAKDIAIEGENSHFRRHHSHLMSHIQRLLRISA